MGPTFDRVILKKMHIGLVEQITDRELRYIARDPRLLEVIKSRWIDAWEFRLSAFVWAREEPLRIVKHKWPRTWWQHLKEAFYRRVGEHRRWSRTLRPLVEKAAKRWPVQWAEREVKAEVFFPEFKHEGYPDNCHKYVVALMHDSMGEWWTPEDGDL